MPAFALLFSLLAFLSSTLYAAECVCPPAKLQDQFDLAKYVFQGRYVELQLAKDQPPAYVFFVEDTFKGIPEEAEMVLTDAQEGTDCALNPVVGKSYLLYTRWEWGLEFMSRCTGTKPIAEANPDRDVIGPGDIWKAKLYSAMRVHCMGKYTTPCCLGSIKAMEEGRFLPEPEGGCPPGSKPNKLRCLEGHTWCEPFK